jgi:hypothetical protein
VLTFTDVDGHRVQCLITDQDGQDIAALEALHRQHAKVEDRVKTLKATGAGHLPFQAFHANAAWFELAMLAHDITVWTQLLTLDGERWCRSSRTWSALSMRSGPRRGLCAGPLPCGWQTCSRPDG